MPWKSLLGILVLSAVTGLTLRARGSSSPFTGELVEATAATTEAGVVVARGLPPGAAAWFASASRRSKDAVRLFPSGADIDDPTYPSARGTLVADGETLRFEPAYPLLEGHGYLLVLEGGGSTGQPDRTVLPFTHRTATDDLPAALVSAVYPTADSLPANQLKLYVHFSQPMTRWDPYDHVILLDATAGDTVTDAFHAMRDGLWDEEGTRFTIVFDPGRVKRGLANNLAFGAPLEPGHRYRLHLSTSLLDARGVPLAQPHVKEFVAVASDRTRPHPDQWTIRSPDPRTHEPLVVLFPEPLDHALLGRLIAVRRAGGSIVSGEVTIGPKEREWRYVPTDPWEPGRYVLRVDTELEDLAGNNIERLFDVDLSTDVPGTGGPGTLDRPFVVEDAAANTHAPEGSTS